MIYNPGNHEEWTLVERVGQDAHEMCKTLEVGHLGRGELQDPSRHAIEGLHLDYPRILEAKAVPRLGHQRILEFGGPSPVHGSRLPLPLLRLWGDQCGQYGTEMPTDPQ